MSQPFGQSEQAHSWTDLQKASDADLLRRLMSGEDDAFAVIVDRYQRLVFSVAVRIVKDEGEAEDVVQTVFMEIFRKAEQFDPRRGTLKMWLLQFAYSRSMNLRHHLEQRQFYSRTELDEVPPFDCATELESGNGLSQGETARLIEQALDTLNSKQRKAIELVYFEGLKFSEAVEKTGESLPALRHHYYRGLMKLREFIGFKSAPGDTRSTPTETPKIQLEVADVRARTV
jgi:RNA polymerase sigma-70 factor (ECF subfamily)